MDGKLIKTVILQKFKRLYEIDHLRIHCGRDGRTRTNKVYVIEKEYADENGGPVPGTPICAEDLEPDNSPDSYDKVVRGVPFTLDRIKKRLQPDDHMNAILEEGEDEVYEDVREDEVFLVSVPDDGDSDSSGESCTSSENEVHVVGYGSDGDHTDEDYDSEGSESSLSSSGSSNNSVEDDEDRGPCACVPL